MGGSIDDGAVCFERRALATVAHRSRRIKHWHGFASPLTLRCLRIARGRASKEPCVEVFPFCTAGEATTYLSPHGPFQPRACRRARGFSIRRALLPQKLTSPRFESGGLAKAAASASRDSRERSPSRNRQVLCRIGRADETRREGLRPLRPPLPGNAHLKPPKSRVRGRKQRYRGNRSNTGPASRKHSP